MDAQESAGRLHPKLDSRAPASSPEPVWLQCRGRPPATQSDPIGSTPNGPPPVLPRPGAVPRPRSNNPRVHLHHTPTHASWLNQVELFFSILERRLLRRGEFTDVDDLADRIIAFIKDYNRRAAPFRWTYDGRPLQVA